MCIAGVQHSGDVVTAPFPNGGRETCTINVAALLAGFPKARYIVLAVYSYTRQTWDSLEDASVFVANPHVRGSGPGGMAVISAARLTGAAKTSVAGYLDLATPSAPGDTPEEPVFGIGTSPEADREDLRTSDEVSSKASKDMRAHFVFTDQEMRLPRKGHSARGSTCAVGKILAKMEESRKKAGAQTLANAAAFQAALVCDRVFIVARGNSADEIGTKSSGSKLESQYLVRDDNEGRYTFYERIAAAFEGITPSAPAAGREGVNNYQIEALGHGKSNSSGPMHTVFFGGDLDDWLEVTRQHDMNKGKGVRQNIKEARAGFSASTLILVNLRSAEKCWTKDEDNVVRVNGATAYEELGQAVREVRVAGSLLRNNKGSW